MLLGSRRQLVNTRQQINGSIRGLLKIYGINIGARTVTKSFAEKVKESIKDLDIYSKGSIEALLLNSEQLDKSLLKLDKLLVSLSKEDKACKLLMTVPGVGVITALTYKSSLG
jgi:transposase